MLIVAESDDRSEDWADALVIHKAYRDAHLKTNSALWASAFMLGLFQIESLQPLDDDLHLAWRCAELVEDGQLVLFIALEP